VINAFGQLPSANQSIKLDRFEFTVIDADERRLNSLAVRPLPDANPAE
jgi:magnesium and cobalt transporter